jgi:putative ABC transport system permease protein
MSGKGATINFMLEPFNRIHLYSPYDGFEPNTSISISIFTAVALLILIIACSTFINLSAARSLKEQGSWRSKSRGRREETIILQFTGESGIILSVITIVQSCPCRSLHSRFQSHNRKRSADRFCFLSRFSAFHFLSPSWLVCCRLYPAVVLTGFKPVQVLKGSFKFRFRTKA